MDTWYIAGPMTGMPQCNIPLFAEVTRELRSRGLNIVNPVETDQPEFVKAALKSQDGNMNYLLKQVNETWGEVLGRDVRLIIDDINGIVLLPGWMNSKGARLEAFVGTVCNHTFYEWYDDDIHWIPRKSVLQCLLST